MKHWNNTPLGVWSALAVLFTMSGAPVRAGETNVESQLRVLQEQNDALQSQLRQQQELIQSLSREVEDIRRANEKRDTSLEEMKYEKSGDQPATSGRPKFFGKIQLSGEGGVGIFETGSQGAFPNAEFRVDEAKLFVDAAVWGDVYAFMELNLATREGFDLNVNLGEFYLDFENVSQLWGHDHQLNIRAGRMDVPFGEEYLYRDAIDNPLISHSVSDLWGVDEGIELYGAFGIFRYVVAVQNGGTSTTRDFDGDKSVAGRLSVDPKPWLHVSVSGMRTGNLDANDDFLSEIWFGNGWFRSLGSASTTRFYANLVEGDVAFRLPHGHIRAFGGYIHYGDNDPNGDNSRDVYYYSVEAVHDLTRKLYAGARFSQILAGEGIPIVGNGDMDTYLFGPLATDMWRLSLGMGYRFSRNLVVKVDYSLERGKELGGQDRDHEDLIAGMAAFAF
jgi:hypothetical protein